MQTPNATPEQQRAINVDDGAYLVIAPPGSGKTFVLTQRIVRLLRESSGESFQILALTFTTKASEEMRARIEVEIGEEWRRVHASTFHAFCLDVLQHYGGHIGIDPTSTIYESEADRLEVLARGLADDGHRGPPKRELALVLAEIGRLKRELIPSAAAPDDRIEGIPLREAYAAYDRTLRLFGGLDFDDLLLLSHRLFTEHPRVANHYRRIYKFVLVDEAQDMSLAQYEVLSSLAGEGYKNVLLVADADQSIYGFAGASHGYLKRFVREFNASELWLRNSFRCGSKIVQAANRLISHNPDRPDRPMPMEAATEAIGLVECQVFGDEAEEASAVTNWVQNLLEEGLPPGSLATNESPRVETQDICVLARSRYALGAVNRELSAKKVPHLFATGEVGLFESALFKAILFALRALANPKDVMSRGKLWAAAGRPETVDEEKVSEALLPEFFRLVEEAHNEWSSVLSRFVEAAEGRLAGPSLVDNLAQINFDWVADERVRDLMKLDQQVLAERWRISSARSGYSERSLGALLGELSLAGRQVLEGPGVRVLSIHAVKGLEFRAVVLVGMNEGVFPDFRATGRSEVEEERRNAYVAVTRASRALLMTRPQTRITSYGRVINQSESRFVEEMGLSMDPVSAPSTS